MQRGAKNRKDAFIVYKEDRRPQDYTEFMVKVTSEFEQHSLLAIVNIIGVSLPVLILH